MRTMSATAVNSISTKQMCELLVGQQFRTFEEFKSALRCWAVEANFSTKYLKSDYKHNVVVCGSSTACKFKVRAMW